MSGIIPANTAMEPEVVRLLKEHYKGGSVLDIGCGDGRYIPLFNDEYLGIESAPGLVNYLETAYPDKHFEHVSIQDYKPKKVFDYLFSSVVLEQVPELPDITKWAKTLILVEPTHLNGWSELRHDYIDIFKPDTAIPMGNGATFMVKKGTHD